MLESYTAPKTFSEKAKATVRKWLRVRERLPQSKNGFDYGLEIGPTWLGWSIHNNRPPNRNGFIYMNAVGPNNAGPTWEFALSPKKYLQDVTRSELVCEFYGMNDSRGTNAFGTNYDGHTIVVPEGQIFFARLATNRTMVYVVRLAKQGGTSSWGTMRAEYVEFNSLNLPPKK